MSRRGFLGRSAVAGLGALGGGALLEACAPALAGSGTVPLPRPHNPVTWPLFADNQPIKSGLAPETGATLQIYNWVAYVNQSCLNSFAKKYNCKVQLTTFNTMNEALSKLRSGLSFDVFMGVTVDTLGQLIETKLIQPLNHSYIPNISQAWPDFTNPFYDQGWRYTVPYTIYTTGISWRKDLVHENPYAMRNPWAMLWQPKYKGKIAILDDYREGISLGLMKNGIYNLNTTDPRQIALSRHALEQLTSLVNVRIDNNDYTEVPTGETWIHHAWSGDMAAAAAYMPKGTPGGRASATGSPRTARARWPTTPTRCCAARTTRCSRTCSSTTWQNLPNVAGEHQLQRLHAAADRGHTAAPGQEKMLPKSLISTAVLPADFRRGVGEFQLPVDADALWQQAWLVVSNGI